MKRDMYSLLCQWKTTPHRRPLLVRGARQVGKTYLVNEFGVREFDSVITLDFEKNSEYKDIFDTLEPREIMKKITLLTGKKIEPGKTLLFLDEAQECPKAIMALRYFYEEAPNLHIIAAGSLVEFALESENFPMLAGRIQHIYLFPLSFGEFIKALGEGELRAHIMDRKNLTGLPGALRTKLDEYVRKYFMIGGMPSVVREYAETGNMIHCQRIQRSIIDTYVDDFGKYSRWSKHRYLKKVFYAIPKMVGRKFVYAHVDNTVKSIELKKAMEALEMAGVARRIKRTSAEGLPLEAGAKENYFKGLFLDVGLFHAASGVYSDTAKAKDFTTLFNGAVAKQFVGQELLAYQDPYTRPSLYYWAREAKNSAAEIDYLVQKQSDIAPLKIKSGSAGRMKSMRMFMETRRVKKAFKISQALYDDPGHGMVSFPFYAIEYFMKNGDGRGEMGIKEGRPRSFYSFGFRSRDRWVD